jgi:tRNA(fMet)-specific endonuclease VapC
LDSDITSFYVKGNLTVIDHVDAQVVAHQKIYMPPFTFYEVKRGLVDSNATRQMADFEDLLKVCPLGKTNDDVFERAANIWVELKQKGRPSGSDMDILIAAWCMVYGLTLVTHNIKHYEAIPGISLVDWSI